MSAKAKDAKKVQSNPKKTFFLKQSSKIENFIIKLTNLLTTQNESNENIEVMIIQTKKETNLGHKDPLNIFAARIKLTNADDQEQYLCSTQFGGEKFETYARAMQGPNTAKWGKAMKEKLDQLHKNKTWQLVYKKNVEPSHWPLEGK